MGKGKVIITPSVLGAASPNIQGIFCGSRVNVIKGYLLIIFGIFEKKSHTLAIQKWVITNLIFIGAASPKF